MLYISSHCYKTRAQTYGVLGVKINALFYQKLYCARMPVHCSKMEGGLTILTRGALTRHLISTVFTSFAARGSAPRAINVLISERLPADAASSRSVQPIKPRLIPHSECAAELTNLTSPSPQQGYISKRLPHRLIMNSRALRANKTTDTRGHRNERTRGEGHDTAHP